MASYLWAVTDKLGDATIYVLDELKFWGEVIIDFWEGDEAVGNNDDMLDEYRQVIREHIEETEEIEKELE